MKLRQVSIRDYKKIKNLFRRNSLGIVNFNRWKNLWHKNPILKERKNWIKGWIMMDGNKLVGHFGCFPTKKLGYLPSAAERSLESGLRGQKGSPATAKD